MLMENFVVSHILKNKTFKASASSLFINNTAHIKFFSFSSFSPIIFLIFFCKKKLASAHLSHLGGSQLTPGFPEEAGRAH